jgi:hypothetical protein
MHAPHGTNLESIIFNALNDPTGEPALDGIGFDYREGPLGHQSIIAAANSAAPRCETPDLFNGGSL